jgi:hypothetical protein
MRRFDEVTGKLAMYSTKSSQHVEKRHSGSHLSMHPASSPGPRHVTRSPDYPHEPPSPAKRPRLASTPSSTSLPSTPTRDRDTVDFYQARFESTMRLKSAWAQLAQRYARPLEEDDIIDLRDARILKDRGVVRGLHAKVSFGGISILDEPGNEANSEAGGAHSEDEDDFDEIDSISREARGLEAQLRRVKPLRDLDSEDEELKDFLEAERRTREEFGPVDEEVDEDWSEDLAQLQDDAEDESGDLADEVIEILESSDEESEHQDFSRTFTTRTHEDSDSEDEDELGRWVHDESTAIYEVVRTPTVPDDEVIEIFDTPPSSPPPSSPPPSLPPSSPSPDPPPRRSFTRASSPY